MSMKLIVVRGDSETQMSLAQATRSVKNIANALGMFGLAARISISPVDGSAMPAKRSYTRRTARRAVARPRKAAKRTASPAQIRAMAKARKALAAQRKANGHKNGAAK